MKEPTEDQKLEASAAAPGLKLEGSLGLLPSPGNPLYLQKEIVEVRVSEPTPGRGMTRDGYTMRCGAPTRYMVRLANETRWRRLMVWQFSNAGTMFVRVLGFPRIVIDLPL